ncbi:putative diguanylate cyclase/phosphodiesterase [Actinoplanes missouriensis 431]|uniref:Putative diguanylate cyclase/phosphodiesterase n=1 Tax=Actinoplanes missouriensis (strain ATCC 14538 / DSM 43046 / CBS 188.64 / JCM 3121 / NBRC 102363 / NCIMB 12654 / NRRL B-3342 / UNCC 431) TaxID=512565 RepID=I0HH71_ACTM4|nr:bifunctional diguanylate cyclase/phosphodiesterase [Actinoplanes missouriensis]BAL92358.1 putative diguanylate cyclase/phosphodiesterase [Actinoplanes missouriensis 431]
MDAARLHTAGSSPAGADVTRTDVTRMDAGCMDTMRLEAACPDGPHPDAPHPDVTHLDAAHPDVTRLDLMRPDLGRPVAGRPSGGGAGDAAGDDARADARHRRTIIVTTIGSIAGGLILWAADPGAFAGLPAAFWVMAVLALIADARPYLVPGRRASAIILPSICFTFAILLAWGGPPALAVQIAAVTVAGVRLRHSVRRTVHLALQHAVALGAAAAVAGLTGLRIGPAELGLATGGPGLAPDGSGLATGAAGAVGAAGPSWRDAALTCAAAAAWIAARYAVAACVRRWTADSKPRTHRRRGRADLLATAALLLLGPILLVAAVVSPALLPLALLALHAVHRMVRWAGESERAARFDALTGLPNRRALQAAIADRSPDRRRALLLLDLDQFRTVNDALGHGAGDRLLARVADRLTTVVPSHDLVVRLGGDEFAVLATRVEGPASARRIAQHLGEALSDPFPLDGMPVELSASIGISLQSGRRDAGTLLREAEAAMYEAKQRGDQVAVHGPDAAHHSPDRLALLAELRTALREDDDGITLFYQPQIAIATGEVIGVEALLRWCHPHRGTVGPEELLRVAEPTPVMRLLTARVLEEVIAQLALWLAEDRPLRAAVNVSARDLHSGDIADRVGALLQRYAVPADLLQLEITESALMADPFRVLETTTRLSRMGVAISLDDFGTGYSSLQHLRRLPLSEVKIDRSFVLGMATDRGDAAIVRSVVALADSLGLRAVAEGVEDEATWRLLAAAGCHTAQGWFHARPMPAADLAEWLARYRPVQPRKIESGKPSNQ